MQFLAIHITPKLVGELRLLVLRKNVIGRKLQVIIALRIYYRIEVFVDLEQEQAAVIHFDALLKPLPRGVGRQQCADLVHAGGNQVVFSELVELVDREQARFFRALRQRQVLQEDFLGEVLAEQPYLFDFPRAVLEIGEFVEVVTQVVLGDEAEVVQDLVVRLFNDDFRARAHQKLREVLALVFLIAFENLLRFNLSLIVFELKNYLFNLGHQIVYLLSFLAEFSGFALKHFKELAVQIFSHHDEHVQLALVPFLKAGLNFLEFIGVLQYFCQGLF